MSAVLSSWNRFSGTLPGRLLVSGAVWLRAPYFLTAAPVILELDEKRSRVRMQKWWLTHNHLGTVHAIASCNLAEYAMGVLAEAAVPASHRWIPIGMDVRYLATAKSRTPSLLPSPLVTSAWWLSPSWPPKFCAPHEDSPAQ